MEKAVIYARYSSDKQTEQSIEGQVRECEVFAKAKGYSIIGKYIDRALTGKVDKRPDFQRMMKDSGKRLFDYVIVYQLDRFARNRYDSAHYKHLLKKNGVKVLSAKENIADDPSGILMETVLEGMAEYYSAELAQKVRRGMFEGFLKGHTSGSCCYGYDVVSVDPSNTNRKTKKFVINNTEAEIVRKIFDDYVGGKKVREIRKWLDDNNIKNRKGIMCENSIMHILKNTKYIGTLSFGDESREDMIPPIVDKGIFEQAQKRIALNKRNTSVFRPIERFLLSSKTYCGHDADNSRRVGIIADTGTGRNGIIHRYYKCLNKKKAKAPCEKEQVSKQWLEDKVVFAAHNLLNRKGMIETIAAQVVAFNDELQANPKLDLYEQQLRDTEKAIANLLRAVEQGLFNESTKQRMLQLESDKADLLWRIDGEKLDVPIKLDLDETIFYFESFAKGDVNDPKFRERLVDAFVNKVILWNDKMIIVYNVKGTDSEKVTIEEIISDYEQEKEKNPERFNSSQVDCGRFNSQQYGDPYGNRTRHTTVKGWCLNRLTKGPDNNHYTAFFGKMQLVTL